MDEDNRHEHGEDETSVEIGPSAAHERLEGLLRVARIVAGVAVFIFIVSEVLRVVALVSNPHRPLTAAQVRYAHAQCARDKAAFIGGYRDHLVNPFDPHNGGRSQPRLIVDCAFGSGSTETHLVWLKSDTEVPSVTSP